MLPVIEACRKMCDLIVTIECIGRTSTQSSKSKYTKENTTDCVFLCALQNVKGVRCSNRGRV